MINQGTRTLHIFLHIAKSGGTTARAMYEQAFGTDRTLIVSDFMKTSAKYPHVTPTDNFVNIRSLERFDAVIGHLPVSLLMGNSALVTMLKRPVIAHSCVRDPIARLISDYNFMQNHQHHPRRDRRMQDPMFYMMEQPANLQCKRLGLPDIYPELPDLLAHINCIRTENSIEIFQRYFEKELGIFLPEAKRKNTTNERYSKTADKMVSMSDFSEDQLRELRDKHSFDTELYLLSGAAPADTKKLLPG